MEDDNKIALIGIFTPHICTPYIYNTQKHTMFKKLTPTNDTTDNIVPLSTFLSPKKYKGD